MSPNLHVVFSFFGQTAGTFLAAASAFVLVIRYELSPLVSTPLFLTFAILGWLISSTVCQRLVPARCEKCRRCRAYLKGTRPFTYVCRKCGKMHRTKWREAEPSPHDFNR